MTQYAVFMVKEDDTIIAIVEAEHLDAACIQAGLLESVSEHTCAGVLKMDAFDQVFTPIVGAKTRRL